MSEITIKIDVPESLETILQAILNGQATPATVEDDIWTINDLCEALKIKKVKPTH